MIVGLRQLGAVLGVSGKTAHKYVHDPRWTFDRKQWPESQVPELRAWRERYYPSDADADMVQAAEGDSLNEIRSLPAERRAKLQLVLERAAKLKLEREMMLGGYLKKDAVEAERLERIQAVKQELATIRLLAIRLEGRTVIEMERILEQWAEEVCNKFSGRS